MTKIPSPSRTAHICRSVIGARRWLRAAFVISLAGLAMVQLLSLMSRLALVPMARADASEPEVVVTKTIDPPDLVSGESAIISFTLSGVASAQVITRPIDVALVVDVSGSMDWFTSPRVVTGTFASDDSWEPIYTFDIEYLIPDSARVNASHPIRLVRHVTPTIYYTDTVDYDLRVSPVATGTWTVEISRTGGPAAYTVELYLPERRLPAATYASKLFVDAIPDTDQAAIAPFNNSAWVAQPLTSSRPAIHNALDLLVAGGSTRIDRGIDTAHGELISSGNALSGSRRAMIVLSDGRQFPPDTLDAVFPAAQSAADDGVILYTIGFGGNADESTLRTVADIGCGRYYFAPDSQSLQQIYQDIAHDLRGRAARSMLIYDILPPGVSLITETLSPGWSYTQADGQTVVTRAVADSLCIAEEMIYTLPVRIDWEPGTSGPVNAPGSGITVTTPSSVTTFIPFTNPTARVGGLLLDKRGPDYAFPSQTITYTLWVTNPGPVSISDVCLGDLLGPEAVGTGASHGGQDVVISDTVVWVWVLDTVATETVLSRTLAARVQDNVPDGSLLWNEAGAGKLSGGSCTAPIAGELLAVDTWPVTITTSGLFASKESRDVNGPPLYPNDTLIYTVTVINVGTSLTQTNVFITDSIPASTTLVTGSPQSNGAVTVTDDTVIARLDQLGPGQTLMLALRVTVNSGTGGDTILNQARVASDQQPNPPQPPPTTDVVTTSAPTLALNKWVVPNVSDRSEDIPTYYFQITNTGDVGLQGIEVWDNQLSPIVGPFTLPDLLPGQVYTISQPMNIAQDTYNVATVTAQVPGFLGSVSATDDAYFDFIQGLDIALDVSIQPALIPAEQIVTYTYHLANVGDDWLMGGTITDTRYGPIASGLSLAPGEDYTRILSQWVTTTTVNVAHAWGTDRLSSNTATSVATATVRVDPSAVNGAYFLYLPVITKDY